MLENFYHVEKEVKETDILCFMGAWHIRDTSEDHNFVKMLRLKRKAVMALEICYQNTMRTIKEDKEYKVIHVDDTFSKEVYRMYGKIGVKKEPAMKRNSPIAEKSQLPKEVGSSGIYLLSNGHAMKMIENQ